MSMGCEEKGSGIVKFWGSSYGLGANEKECYKPAIVKLFGPVISSSPLIGRELAGQGLRKTRRHKTGVSFFAKLLSSRDVQEKGSGSHMLLAKKGVCLF